MNSASSEQGNFAVRASSVQPLIGALVTGLRSPHGSILLVEVRAAAGLVAARHSLNVVGAWRLATATTVVFDHERCAALGDVEMPALQRLVGDSIVEAMVSHPAADLRISFSNGSVLDVFDVPGPNDEPSWFVVEDTP
jgi:hypothetical protein